MSYKSISCRECRKHHRKCVRTDDTEVCRRCTRLHLVCLLPTMDRADDPNEPVDGTKQMKHLQDTADLLQHTIGQLEREMEEYRNSNNYASAIKSALQPTTRPSMSALENNTTYYSTYDSTIMDCKWWLYDTCSDSGGSTSTNNSSCTGNGKSNNNNNRCSDDSILDDTMMDYSDDTCTTCMTPQSLCRSTYDHQKPQQQQQQQQQQNHLLETGKEWKMTLVNGHWQIETGINTLGGLEDLRRRLLSQTPLSPFQSMYRNTPIVIQPCDERTLFPLTVKLTRNHLLYRPSNPVSLNHLPLFPTPSLLHHKPKWVIDNLVHMYLKSYNPSMTFVHEPTYLTHYQQLKKPLACPVTMAICSYVCCGHHYISTSTSSSATTTTATGDSDIDGGDDDISDIGSGDDFKWFSNMVDRRAMGEYFYRRCRDTLDDIFDDPRRRLETVMAVNILKRFLMNTLRISEMRKLENIAYMICLDLKSTYVKRSQSSKVERALFARHYAFAIWCRVAVDFFMDSVSRHDGVDFIRLEILPGESEFTKKFLDIQNHFFDLFLHPSVYMVFGHVQKILLGTKVEMPLEMILRFEQVIRKWWQNIPLEFRFCDDPYDFDTVKSTIHQTKDDSQLTLFLFFLDVVVSFHSCLLKIQTEVGNGNDTLDIDSNVLSHIREKSVKACLDFSEMLILIINQLDTNVAYSQFLGDVFLFVAVDVLGSLTFLDDMDVALKAKQKLAMCFSALDAADFMTGHRVPLVSSPLTTTLIDSNVAMFHLYNQYPQPRYALLYDICRFLSPLDPSPL